MDEGTPGGDPTEGREGSSDGEGALDDLTVLDAPQDPDIEERELSFVDPHREGRGVERVVRWKRTVTIEGPQDWVRETWDRALADGVHIVGVKRGIQCRIETMTEDWESVRGLHGCTSNAAMETFRQQSPEIYDGVHGKGAAAAHAPDPKAPSASTPTTEAAHYGQYL